MIPTHCIFKLIDNKLACGVVELPEWFSKWGFASNKIIEQALANAIWFKEEKDIETIVRLYFIQSGADSNYAEREYLFQKFKENSIEIMKPYKLPEGVEIKIRDYCEAEIGFNCHCKNEIVKSPCGKFVFLKQFREQSEPKTVCAKCGGKGYWTYYSTNEKVKCGCQVKEQKKEESQGELRNKIIKEITNQIYGARATSQDSSICVITDFEIWLINYLDKFTIQRK